MQKQTPPQLQPGNDPCYYTKIEVQKYKDEKLRAKDGELLIIFDEEKLTGKNPQLDLIAGDESPAYIQISADLHTREQCRPNRHTEGGSHVFYFPEELSAAKQNIEELDVEYNSIRKCLLFLLSLLIRNFCFAGEIFSTLLYRLHYRVVPEF